MICPLSCYHTPPCLWVLNHDKDARPCVSAACIMFIYIPCVIIHYQYSSHFNLSNKIDTFAKTQISETTFDHHISPSLDIHCTIFSAMQRSIHHQWSHDIQQKLSRLRKRFTWVMDWTIQHNRPTPLAIWIPNHVRETQPLPLFNRYYHCSEIIYYHSVRWKRLRSSHKLQTSLYQRLWSHTSFSC